MESPLTGSSPLTSPSPSFDISGIPDIEFLEGLEMKSFWDIEYELNVFAKTQGYKYMLDRGGIPKNGKKKFKMFCSHYHHDDLGNGGTKKHPELDTSPGYGCRHYISFRYCTENPSGEERRDRASGPFKLDEKCGSGLIEHNHPPSEHFLNLIVQSPEDRKSRYVARLNTRLKNKGLPLFTHPSRAVSTSTSLSVNHHEDSENEEYDEDKDKEVQELEDDGEIYVNNHWERQSDSMNIILVNSITDDLNGSSSRFHEYLPDGKSSPLEDGQQATENIQEQDSSWQVSFAKLQLHFERFKKTIQDRDEEIIHLKRKLNAMENRLEEDDVAGLRDERDTYKRKYEELKRITKEQQSLMEGDRKRRQEFEKCEKDSSDKKRKVNERWLALLED
ncbi:hypothetical protein L486_04876 [Kwoniella mangroviensis CBS 10435]|uniref:Uncharacterized protein n=1 Tax=Kwoniella mangroviensis CBS 10435 TaxID=1331196 RepID=A0A1B9IPB5_9TREE|nr:hypothetical protein L486_04876 [Kwoniella mangroviensis CBS 10435]